MSKYIQDFLPGFLEMEAEAREAAISETETQIHLAKQFCRYDKMLRTCKNKRTKELLEKAKRDLLKLMQRT